MLSYSTASNPLADLFPIGRTGVQTEPSLPSPEAEEEAITKLLHAVMSQLIPRRPNPDSDSDIPRPGCEYRRYRTESELPDTARLFYRTVAEVAGISLDTLVRAVFQTELRIGQWQDDRRRRELYGDSVPIDLSDNNENEEME